MSQRRTSRRRKDSYAGPPRCAIYVRVSDPKQERDGTSLTTQQAACRALAEQQGYAVTGVYSDVHTGKDLFERSGLTDLRTAVRAQEIDVIVAHALDRFSRDQNHLGLLFSECEHKNVRVELVTEKLEDSPQGRLLQSLSGYVAAVERTKIIERTQRGTRARADSGKLLAGGKPLYGYRWRDGTKSALDIEPVAASIVRRIFREAAMGVSMRKLAQALTEEHASTPGGGAYWWASTIHDILKNPAYIGRATAFHSSHRPDVIPIMLPEGTIPALTDAGTFRTVQGRLAVNKERATRNNRAPNKTLLRGGIARCGYCRNALSTKQLPDKETGYYFCSCTNRDRYGCPNFGMQAHVLDPAVWALVEQFLTDDRLIAAKLQAESRANPTEDALAQIQEQAKLTAARRERLARMIANLDDDEAAAPLATELKALAREASRIEAQRAAVEAQNRNANENQRRITSLIEWRRTIAANIPNLNYEQRRQLLDALGMTVFIWSAEHDPRWEVLMHPQVGDSEAPIVYNSACARPSA